jgi:hypothetical protein
MSGLSLRSGRTACVRALASSCVCVSLFGAGVAVGVVRAGSPGERKRVRAREDQWSGCVCAVSLDDYKRPCKPCVLGEPNPFEQ